MRVQQQGWGRKQKGSVSAEVARTEPAGSSMTDQGKFPAILAKFLFALKSWRWICFPQTMHLTDAACCSCGLGSPHGLAALPLVVRASVGNGRTSRFPAGMTTKKARATARAKVKAKARRRQGQRQGEEKSRSGAGGSTRRVRCESKFAAHTVQTVQIEGVKDQKRMRAASCSWREEPTSPTGKRVLTIWPKLPAVTVPLPIDMVDKGWPKLG